MECYWWEKAGNPRSTFRDRHIATNMRILNVMRELDAGCEWFHKNRIEQGAQYLEDVLWYTLSVHFVDRISSFERFGFPKPDESLHKWLDDCEHAIHRGLVFFANIHQTIGWRRYRMVMEGLLQDEHYKVIAAQIRDTKSLEGVYNIMMKVDGNSHYNTWQEMAYMLEAGVLPYGENNWVRLGPGAHCGLRYIWNRNFGERQGLQLLKWLYEEQFIHLPKYNFKIPEPYTELTLKALEHTLCEYCRYSNRLYNH